MSIDRPEIRVVLEPYDGSMLVYHRGDDKFLRGLGSVPLIRFSDDIRDLYPVFRDAIARGELPPVFTCIIGHSGQCHDCCYIGSYPPDDEITAADN